MLGCAAAFIARGLIAIIDVVSNLSFYGHFSFHPSSPAHNTLGLLVVVRPVIGGIIVGIMARIVPKRFAGMAFPRRWSRCCSMKAAIPPRITILKPLSSAVAIGSGGPFGADGPIIATGGALGVAAWAVTTHHGHGAQGFAGGRSCCGHDGNFQYADSGSSAGCGTAFI